jgi:hypothetical protein
VRKLVEETPADFDADKVFVIEKLGDLRNLAAVAKCVR